MYRGVLLKGMGMRVRNERKHIAPIAVIFFGVDILHMIFKDTNSMRHIFICFCFLSSFPFLVSSVVRKTELISMIWLVPKLPPLLSASSVVRVLHFAHCSNSLQCRWVAVVWRSCATQQRSEALLFYGRGADDNAIASFGSSALQFNVEATATQQHFVVESKNAAAEDAGASKLTTDAALLWSPSNDDHDDNGHYDGTCEATSVAIPTSGYYSDRAAGERFATMWACFWPSFSTLPLIKQHLLCFFAL